MDGVNWHDVTASLSTSDWYTGTTIQGQANPVVGITVGDQGDSIAFDMAQLTDGIVVYNPIPTNGAVAVKTADLLRIPLADVPGLTDILAESLGAEINSGTLTAGYTYKITDDDGGHFFAGSDVGKYFNSDGTETCDATNKVQRVLNPGTDGKGPPEGMVAAWMVPGYDKTDDLRSGFVGAYTGAYGRTLYTQGDDLSTFISYVSTGDTARVTTSYYRNVPIFVLVKFGYLSSGVAKFKTGYMDSSGSITWGAESDYPGFFDTDGGYLNLFYNPGGAWYLLPAIWDKIFTDSEIESWGAP